MSEALCSFYIVLLTTGGKQQHAGEIHTGASILLLASLVTTRQVLQEKLADSVDSETGAAL